MNRPDLSQIEEEDLSEMGNGEQTKVMRAGGTGRPREQWERLRRGKLWSSVLICDGKGLAWDHLPSSVWCVGVINSHTYRGEVGGSRVVPAWMHHLL